jgi:hypothetical protein
VGEFGSDHAVLRERAIDRRRGVELHVRAEVVVSGSALSAASAVLLWLDGDTFTDPGLRYLLADGDDSARKLMAEDEWTLHNEVTDPPVPVIVSV